MLLQFILLGLLASSCRGDGPQAQALQLESFVRDTSKDQGLPFISRDLDFLEDVVDRIETRTCREHSHALVAGLRNLTTWAVEFYDATGKLPEGVLSGSTYQLGNFDECLDIGKSEDDPIPPGIRPQYCLGNVKIGVPSERELRASSSLSPMWRKFAKLERRWDDRVDELHWGLCVPASCTPDDVNQVVEAIFESTLAKMNFQITVNVTEQRCYKDEPVQVGGLAIAYLTVILVVLALSVVASIYDLCYVDKSKPPKGMLPQMLLVFSTPSNLKKLCGPAHEDLGFECISGIKFLTMVFIIAGHTLIFIISGPVLNVKFWQESIAKMENSIFVNNPLLVDTFLLLGGFLLARILLQELDKRKSVNFGLLYLARYLRLTPAYMVVVGLYVTWLPMLDRGPLWWRMRLENERCSNSWWSNALYINNYVNTDQLCMFQSWYLSVDTQLFVLAPAILYPLWRWRKAGHIILGSATVFALALPFICTLVGNLDPTLLIYSSEVKDISTNDYFKGSYIKTHMRAGAYCFGLLYGYIVYRIQNSDTKISKKTVRIGWILGLSAMVISMCSISMFYSFRKNFSTVEAAFYSSLHRALWSAGAGWLVLACVTDNSGPLRKILKWRPFVPLSRLTYSAYLVNGLVELHSASTVRVPQHLDNYSLFGEVLSHLMLTFCGAILLSATFESPILGLERIFLRRERKSDTLTKKTDSEETTSTEA